jgi:hypothetical protein
MFTHMFHHPSVLSTLASIADLKCIKIEKKLLIWCRGITLFSK